MFFALQARCLWRRRTYARPSRLAICGANPVPRPDARWPRAGLRGAGGSGGDGHTHVSVRLMAHRKVRLAAGRAYVRGIVATQWTRTRIRRPEYKFCSFSERICARTPSGTCDYLCRRWLWSWWPLGSIGRQFYVIPHSSGFSRGLWECVGWNGLNGSTCALVYAALFQARGPYAMQIDW